MRTIRFIGSTNSSYARGKDKKKRKSRSLLIASGLGGAAIGSGIGGTLAQTGLVTNKLKKAGLKNGYKFNLSDKVLSHGFGKFIVDNLRDPNNAKELALSKKSQRLLKVYNKARLRGGVRGAAIGAGVGLGGTWLANKIKNKKDK